MLIWLPISLIACPDQKLQNSRSRQSFPETR
jgi:hypothetical protein